MHALTNVDDNGHRCPHDTPPIDVASRRLIDAEMARSRHAHARRQAQQSATTSSMKGKAMVIGLLILGLIVGLGVAAILGWTADSRDDEQKLWPLGGTRP